MWGWTLAENQKHQIPGSQINSLLWRKRSSNFSITECYFLNFEKLERLEKLPIPPLINPFPIPGFPLHFLQKFPIFPLQSFLKNLISPLWRGGGGGGGGFGLCLRDQNVTIKILTILRIKRAFKIIKWKAFFPHF